MPKELFTPEQRHWDYTTYPPEIQGIVRILFKYEDNISDGFAYYTGSSDARKILTALAYELLEEVKDV